MRQPFRKKSQGFPCPQCFWPAWVDCTRQIYRPEGHHTRRYRLCSNPDCSYRFRTVELLVVNLEPDEEDR